MRLHGLIKVCIFIVAHTDLVSNYGARLNRRLNKLRDFKCYKRRLASFRYSPPINMLTCNMEFINR